MNSCLLGSVLIDKTCRSVEIHRAVNQKFSPVNSNDNVNSIVRVCGAYCTNIRLAKYIPVAKSEGR